MKNVSLKLYKYAAKMTGVHGIVITDTQFEFGLIDKELALIDELFTPDPLQLLPCAKYAPEKPQETFGKQLICDYLGTIGCGFLLVQLERPDAGDQRPDANSVTGVFYFFITSRWSDRLWDGRSR